MLLHATHTHLYPGLEGRVAGLSRIAELQTEGDCLVEFADGSATCAKISRKKNGWQLRADAYRTAAGTDIAERRWRVHFEEDGNRVIFRILARAAV